MRRNPFRVFVIAVAALCSCGPRTEHAAPLEHTGTAANLMHDGQPLSMDVSDVVRASIDTSFGVLGGEPSVNWSALNLSIGSLSPQQIIALLSNGQTRREFKERFIFRIDAQISIAAVYAAKQRALDKIEHQAELSRAEARTQQYALFQGAIREEILRLSNVPRALYDSNPGVRAAIDAKTAEVFRKKKALIDKAIDEKVHAAVAEAERRLDRLEERTMLQGFLVTLGGISEDKTTFFYFQVGKGSLGAPHNRRGHTDLQNLTGVNDAVEQLSGYQMTPFVKASLVKILKDNTSLELSVAGLHARGRGVPFIESEQYVKQHLSLSKDTFDAADKFFQLDSVMLQAILRDGPNKFFATLFAGTETKMSIGARIAVGSGGRTFLHVMLLHVGRNPHAIQSGFYGRVLLEHAITDRLRGFAGGGWLPIFDEGDGRLERQLAAQIGVSYQFCNNVSGTAMVTVSKEEVRGYLGVRITLGSV